MPEKTQYYIMACMILASMAHVAIYAHLFNKKQRRQKAAVEYYENKFNEIFFMFRSENDRLQWELNTAKELIAEYESEILAKGEENNDDKK